MRGVIFHIWQALISAAFQTAIMDHRIITLTILLMILVLMAGCTSKNETIVPDKNTPKPAITPETTAEERSDLTSPGGDGAVTLMGENSSEMVTENQTGTHETMPLNDTINIFLKENPTTGYMWNATISAGLMIENDTYVADPVKPGVVGSGGMHYWLVRGVEKGNQTFNAVYKRPWEPNTGNETQYMMNITVL
ncbi:MAG: protease inhibitor I42 family protein [Methanobacteriota archaeon]